MTSTTFGDSCVAADGAGVGIGRLAEFLADAKACGRYLVSLVSPRAGMRKEYVRLRDERELALAAGNVAEAVRIERLMEGMTELAWNDDFPNLVTTAGKNDALDKYLSGSSYTAAWYLGLIGGASYTTGPAAGDTAASHGGWTESTAYTQANRPTAAFSGAAAGSKSLSAPATFSINADVTIKGAILISNNTKGGTTGVLYSAGLFTGGDKIVQNGDTLNVSYTASL